MGGITDMRMRHGHEVGGSAVAHASCLGTGANMRCRWFVQACLVPGSGDHLIMTGGGGRAGREQAEVAMSWIHDQRVPITEMIGVESSLVRPLRSGSHGVHIHMMPHFMNNKSPGCLGATIAIALLSLATRKLPSEGVALMGELRLDGARASYIPGLSKSVVQTCRSQGIQKLIVGTQQVSSGAWIEHFSRFLGLDVTKSWHFFVTHVFTGPRYKAEKLASGRHRGSRC